MSFLFFGRTYNIFLECAWFSLDINSLIDKFCEFFLILYEKRHITTAVINMEISLDEIFQSFLEFLRGDEIVCVFKE